MHIIDSTNFQIQINSTLMFIASLLQSYGQTRAAEYFVAKENYSSAKGLDVKRTHNLDDRK